jgi:hypothetical protein
MRYLGDGEPTEGESERDLGALYQAPDGTLYQVEGLEEEDEAEDLGLGALYQAPDGTLYQVDGLEEQEDEADALGLGALYQAPDGTLYQVEGLGQEEGGEEEEEEAQDGEEEQTGPTSDGARRPRQRPGMRRGVARGRARRLRPIAPRGRPVARRRKPGLRPVAVQAPPAPGQRAPGAGPVRRQRRAPRRRKGLLAKVLRPLTKVAKAALPFVPGIGPVAAAGLTVAEKALRKPGVAGAGGLGALYQAPDGTLYQLQALPDQDETLTGPAPDEEREELTGGDGQDDDDLDGYVREDEAPNLRAYEPRTPPRTPWFAPPSQSPRMWESPW